MGEINGEKEFDQTVLNAALEKFEQEAGVYWNEWIQPLRGEFVGEFSDIKWTAVQMLCYWSEDTGVPLEKCLHQFLFQFRMEMKNMMAQKDSDGILLPLEHWSRLGFLTTEEQERYDDPTVYGEKEEAQ